MSAIVWYRQRGTNHPPVCRYGLPLAFAKTGNQQDADDVFQEVFVRYVRKRPVFKNDEHAKTWFLRVTVNCANSLLSSPFRRHSAPLEEGLSETSAQPGEKTDLKQAILSRRAIRYPHLELGAVRRPLGKGYRSILPARRFGGIPSETRRQGRAQQGGRSGI